MKKVFSQVGTVISLRMPNDPESGRSRGFAFCEYREQESVNQAIKHFSGYDLSGRKIRVDSAANNQDKDAKVSGPVNNDVSTDWYGWTVSVEPAKDFDVSVDGLWSHRVHFKCCS